MSADASVAPPPAPVPAVPLPAFDGQPRVTRYRLGDPLPDFTGAAPTAIPAAAVPPPAAPQAPPVSGAWTTSVTMAATPASAFTTTAAVTQPPGPGGMKVTRIGLDGRVIEAPTDTTAAAAAAIVESASSSAFTQVVDGRGTPPPPGPAPPSDAFATGPIVSPAPPQDLPPLGGPMAGIPRAPYGGGCGGVVGRCGPARRMAPVPVCGACGPCRPRVQPPVPPPADCWACADPNAPPKEYSGRVLDVQYIQYFV